MLVRKIHMARTSKYQTGAAPSFQKSEWRAGLYIRLSREDGDKAESESIASQKALLERYARENDFLRFEYYIDDGWSGTDFERPSFLRMMGDITGRRINCVIVKDLSRFGRNYVEAGKYLETVFPLFGIRFIAVNDNIDSVLNPQSMNNVIVPFKNIMNDEYCRDISMKVRSSLDIRRKEGKFIGSFAPYGYKKDKSDHNKLVVDEDAATVVRLIFERFLSGYSIAGIAKELSARRIPNPAAYKKGRGSQSGIWQHSTVRRILNNELYIGNMVQKKNEIISYKIHVAKAVEKGRQIVVENTHEPVILREDFERAQSLLKRDTRTSPKDNKLSVFAGFLKCADCGRALQKRTVKQPYKTYEYYSCSTYKQSGGRRCSKHAVRADILSEAVLAFLNEYISLAVDFDRFRKRAGENMKSEPAVRRLNAEINGHRQKLETLQNLILEIYPDYKSGILSKEQYFELKERYERGAEREKQAIERAEEELRKSESGQDASNEFIESFCKYRGLKELTREVVVELIENVYVERDGTVEVRLKCKDSLRRAMDYFGAEESTYVPVGEGRA